MNINDGIKDQGEFQSEHLVYRSGVKVKYPNKAAPIYFGILPAIPSGAAESTEEGQITCNTTEYLPYRNKDGAFTEWATAAYYYAFVNHEKSLLSPHTFGATEFDPIEEITKHAKRNPSWCEIVGYGKDGKRMQDTYSNPDVRIPAKQMIFCMNTVVLFDPKIKQSEVYILQSPSTAFRGQGGNAGRNGGWGLVAALNMKNRKNSGGDSEYYWGDVTDPEAIVPLVLGQEKPPSGSRKIYNISVNEDEDSLSVSDAVLSSRYNLSDIFYNIESGEIVDYITHVLSDVPDLLRMSFSSKIPNYESILANALKVRVDMGANSDDDDDEEEEEFYRPRKSMSKTVSPDKEDEIDMSAPKRPRRVATLEEPEEAAPARTPSRSFAPAVSEDSAEDEEATEEEKDPAPRTLVRKKKTSRAAALISEDD